MNSSIPVNLLNPGQYFACCGLLELAHRVSPNTRGWFANNQFHISLPDYSEIIRTVAKAEIKWITQKEVLQIGTPFNLRLDWWSCPSSVIPNTWSGQQKEKLVINLSDRQKCLSNYQGDQSLFDDVIMQSVSLGLDSRHNISAKSIGFSLNDTKASDPLGPIEPVCYPALDLLCLIGLQRFRPQIISSQQQEYGYSTWEEPLEVSLAALACGGILTQLSKETFSFRVMGKSANKTNNYLVFETANLISRKLT